MKMPLMQKSVTTEMDRGKAGTGQGINGPARVKRRNDAVVMSDRVRHENRTLGFQDHSFNQYIGIPEAVKIS